MDLDASVDTLLFTAFDFETTGLYSASDRVCEIGAVQFRGMAVLSEFSELVNPGIPIPPDAGAVSGITDIMVAKQPAVAEMLPVFMEFIGDSILVAHNAEFDVGFLRAALHREGLSDVANSIIDTQKLAQKAFPRRRSYSLQNLAEELNIAPGSAHRALDDAVLCMKLFRECVGALSFMGDLSLREVLT
ncbi:MAG: 3'-5' exonuclease [Spirochaeta sp.]|nr:3'-5' exonuclease [Spirochaeta sp.]